MCRHNANKHELSKRQLVGGGGVGGPIKDRRPSSRQCSRRTMSPRGWTEQERLFLASHRSPGPFDGREAIKVREKEVKHSLWAGDAIIYAETSKGSTKAAFLTNKWVKWGYGISGQFTITSVLLNVSNKQLSTEVVFKNLFTIAIYRIRKMFYVI